MLLNHFEIEAIEIPWTNVSRLRRQMEKINPDVYLVDPAIKSLNPGRLVSELEMTVDASVSMMAVDGSAEGLDEAVSAGANGFVTMDTSVEEFVDSLKLLAKGNIVATASTETTLADIASPTSQVPESRAQLSPRELEITEFVAGGLTNREMAERFELTEGTVKVHLRNIFRKLNISNRAELASFAHVSGIVGS
jgi:two-component system nitrate/nitrite response regulator NarL